MVPTCRDAALGQKGVNFMDESTETEITTVLMDIRHLSAAQFTALGVAQMAYVKPVLLNGARAFAIHGADGTPMAVAGNEEVALAAIVQHEMTPARVH
jgi:hypothetical protein